MAAPRVFISSTYYDLKHVRNDISNFLKTLGYEPVMHDKGGVAYAQTETLEESCYSELSTCDIVVCIIGSKYGTQSMHGNYSITMQELNSAIKEQKKIYIFIQKDVYIENRTYLANRTNDKFKCVCAEDIKIHEFIAEIQDKVKTHPIAEFENISDIIDNLRSQFAGLFQHLLRIESTLTDEKTYYDLKKTSEEIRSLVDNIREENNSFFEKFDSTIYTTNFALTLIRRRLGMKKSTFFARNKSALDEILEAFGFEVGLPIAPYTYEKKLNNSILKIIIQEELFDDNDNLKEIRSIKDAEKYISFEEEEVSDDTLPF